MFNRAILIGRLTADPELKQTQSGISVCSFSIAVDRRFSGRDSERKTDFINITSWRQQAEFVCRYFHKGDVIGVEGSIQTRNYEDKNGNKRTAYRHQRLSLFFGGSRHFADGLIFNRFGLYGNNRRGRNLFGWHRLFGFERRLTGSGNVGDKLTFGRRGRQFDGRSRSLFLNLILYGFVFGRHVFGRFDDGRFVFNGGICLFPNGLNVGRFGGNGYLFLFFNDLNLLNLQFLFVFSNRRLGFGRFGRTFLNHGELRRVSDYGKERFRAAVSRGGAAASDFV